MFPNQLHLKIYIYLLKFLQHLHRSSLLSRQNTNPNNLTSLNLPSIIHAWKTVKDLLRIALDHRNNVKMGTFQLHFIEVERWKSAGAKSSE